MLVQVNSTSGTLDITYDASGIPLTLKYGSEIFYYVTNLQGDVIGLKNSNGVQVTTYTYDAWGKMYASSTSHIIMYNPLTYRGYVYDRETGLYYLQSRYYNPEWGRFINADDFPATGQGLLGNNMFAYCGNNPVSRADVSGYFWDTIFDVVSLVVSVVEVVANPTDVGAWVGLVCDVVDVAVPFVGGLGEVADAINSARKIGETADKINDARKTGEVLQESVSTGKKLHRPYIRKSTREAVEKVTPRMPDGRFIDVNTGMPINGKYDLGHITGKEFWRERNEAMAKGWTQKQFNHYMNNPAFYRIEDPISNRSHKFEMPR